MSLLLAAASWDTAVSNQATAAVHGRVLSAATGRALAGATVRLVNDGAGRQFRQVTGADGTFLFDNVVLGSYTVTASHPAYLDGTAGQRAFGEAGALIQVAVGSSVAADVFLVRGGAITGRVVDEFGEGVIGVKVDTFLVARTPQGNQLQKVDALVYPTNDIGQFRIAKLMPGTYYVGARRPHGNEDQLTIWHPGVADVTQARPIRLELGQEIGGVDLMLTAASGATISGTMRLSTGAPAAMGVVGLLQKASTSRPVALHLSASVRSGRYAIDRVPPGSYTLSAHGEPSGGGQRQYVRQSVHISGDLPWLDLQLRPPAVLRGRIEGAGVLPASLSVVALPAEPGLDAHTKAKVASDGSFALALVPGRWLLAIEGLGASAAIQTVLIGGADARSGILVGSSDINGARITLDPFGSVVGGRITGASKGAHPAVLLMADQPVAHPEAVAGVIVSRPAGDGFLISHVPSGAYQMLAVDLSDLTALYDLRFQTALRQRAESVTLAPGATSYRDLKLQTIGRQ